MADNRTPQPLVDNQPIVNAGGTPTQYFIRWAQERQIAIEDGITKAEAEKIIAEFLEDHRLREGLGISILPSGSVADSPIIALSANLDDLKDVDLSTPPTGGQVLGFDSGSQTWKAVDQSGGGGDSGPLWGFSGLKADDPFKVTATAAGSYSNNPQNSMGLAPVLSFYWGNASGTGQTLTFDFRSALIISGIGIISDRVSSASQGFWQISGSQDNIGYTNIGLPIEWKRDQSRAMLFDNQAAYRYYKMVLTSGSTNNDQYITQFLFRFGERYTPPVAGHIFWRIMINTTQGGGYPACGGLEVRPVPGTPNPATGGTPTVSSTLYGSASGAWSGADAVGWVAGNYAPQWAVYEFSSPVDGKEFALTSSQTYYGNEGPKDFTIDYSDDGVSWTTIKTVTGEAAWGPRQTRLYSLP